MKNTNKAADFLIGLFVVALSIVFFVQANAMPKAELGIGPGDYPKVICYVLFALGFILAIRTVVECKGIPMIDFKNINKRYLLRAGIMVLMSYVYYKFVKKVGFLLMTPVYLYMSELLFGYKKKIKGAIITVIFTTGIYFLFTKVFLVILPRGILG